MRRGEDKIQNMKLEFDLTNLSRVVVLKLSRHSNRKMPPELTTC